MSLEKIDSLLYRYRYVVVTLTCVFVAYVNLYMWFFVPFADFGYTWGQNHSFQIDEVEEDSPVYTVLQPGDVIIAVDGRATVPGRAIYPLPIQPSYQFTIERGGLTLLEDVPFPQTPGEIALSYRLPAGLLSFMLWFLGPLILYFAKRDNWIAVHAGYIFMLGGVIVISIQGFVLSVPFAWVGGVPLIFSGTVALLYLGFIPRSEKLSNQLRVTFGCLWVLAIGCGVAAVVEVLLLFPQQTSFQQLTGINLYRVGFITHACGLVGCFLILLWRYGRMPDSYEKRQIQVLLLFIGLATLPAALLTFIPYYLIDQLYLPFPVSISLLVLFPLGYFYVIYRNGYLGLDIFFSKAISIITLLVVMLVFYSTCLYLLQNQFGLGVDTITVPALTLVPTLLLTLLASTPISNLVQEVFFGQQAIRSEQLIPQIASQLSLKPELTTLKAIVQSLAIDFQITTAVLVLKDTDSKLAPVADVGQHGWESASVEDLAPFSEPIIRSTAGNETHPLLTTYRWIEMLVPIAIRNEQIGLLALSRPSADFFNIRHVLFLSRVANMIAVGSEAIFLFEASRRLSLELLSAQEEERKRLASQIHDNPLQTLTFIRNKLGKLASDLSGQEQGTAHYISEQTTLLDQTIRELRETCAGLYPTAIEQGYVWMAQDLAKTFEKKYGLNVQLDLQIADETSGTIKTNTAVYRILLESLNNIFKHAQTKTAYVTMQQKQNSIVLTVADEGIGGSFATLSRNDLLRKRHLGVFGMFEWAKLANGTLSIVKNNPCGTKVILEIPALMPDESYAYQISY